MSLTNSSYQHVKNIFNWLLFAIAFLLIIYAFGFSTFHLSQITSSSKLFNIKLPFINSTIVYLFFAISALLFTIQLSYNRFKKNFDVLDVLFIAIILFTAISYIWGASKLTYFSVCINAIITYWCYVIFVQAIQKSNGLFIKWAAYLIVALSILFSCYYFFANSSILLKLSEGVSDYQSIITSTKSFVGGKNQTALFLAILIPLILLITKSKQYFFTLIVAAFLLFHLLIMGSRNAYISIFIFGISYVALAAVKVKHLVKLLIALILLGGLFLLLVDVDLFINQLKYNTYDSRFVLWQRTLNMGFDHFIIGAGAGQWDEQKLSYNIWANYVHPHNDFVRNFAELGSIGFILYYSVFGMMLYRCHQILAVNKKFAAIAFAAILGYLSLSFFDEMKFKINYNILLVFLFALIQHQWYSNMGKVKQSQLFGVLFSAVSVLAAAAIILYAVQLQKEMQQYKSSQTQLKNKNKTKAIEALQQINQHYLPKIGTHPVNCLIADHYFSQNKLDSARLYYDKVTAVYPSYERQVASGLFRSMGQNRNHQSWRLLAKLFLVAPCNNIFEQTLIDLPKTKRSNYYQKIIDEQIERCVE